MKQFEVNLHDNGDGNGRQKVLVIGDDLGIQIKADGYGDVHSKAPHGCPVLLEFYDGKLILHVWSDINQEDPTHSIDLSGALEKHRKF
jgi:hypothetical protein